MVQQLWIFLFRLKSKGMVWLVISDNWYLSFISWLILNLLSSISENSRSCDSRHLLLWDLAHSVQWFAFLSILLFISLRFTLIGSRSVIQRAVKGQPLGISLGPSAASPSLWNQFPKPGVAQDFKRQIPSERSQAKHPHAITSKRKIPSWKF